MWLLSFGITERGMSRELIAAHGPPLKQVNQKSQEEVPGKMPFASCSIFVLNFYLIPNVACNESTVASVSPLPPSFSFYWVPGAVLRPSGMPN